ncbi:MAG: NAD(P)-binding domain-containing protein [Chitinophagaceae bacterium]|nr:NAD(P)-binding domain-containing protein [Chitinophagaceae bacterium]
MDHIKTVAIIGAGLSGIVTAKTCLEYGYKVMMFEKNEELGGVWASSRRYPGVTTQNTKDTYAFSDFPMPKHFPEWPRGEQVQNYLLAYAEKFAVLPLIQFAHEVEETKLEDSSWIINGSNVAGSFTEKADFLIVCNGTFSDPSIPVVRGIEKFVEAGGEILHSSQFNALHSVKNKHIVVVGYSKSATDIVTAAAETAKSAHIVFRDAKWKIPRYVNGINMKYLLLNRLGEAFIKPQDQHNRVERFVHKIGLAKTMLSFMERHIIKKQLLRELDLIPTASIQAQAFGEINLETEQFFQKIKAGEIIAKRSEIDHFDGKKVILRNGEQINCDLVIFATGFKQSLPFLPNSLQEKFRDKDGNYLLYHHILPAGVPSLAFVGYNSSIQCPLSSEIAALWVCEYLKGRINPPTQAEIIKEGKAFLEWRFRFRPNGASSGLSTMPGTIHHVDMLLKEMNASLPFHSLIPDWLLTINPSRYKQVRKKIVRRNQSN